MVDHGQKTNSTIIDHDQPTMVDHGQPWSVSSGIDHHDHGHLMTQNYSP